MSDHSTQEFPNSAIDRQPGNESELVLAINAGSSSLKFALFSGLANPVRQWSGSIDRIGTAESKFTLHRIGDPHRHTSTRTAPDHASCFEFLLGQLNEIGQAEKILATVHRVVHGGPNYSRPQRITAELMDELQRFRPWASEHLPAEIDLIRLFRQRFPTMRQIACFDTAFHHNLPPLAQLLPIPRRYAKQGIRRYGFHGLSYEFLLQELDRQAGSAAARGRLILAHLGNGASLAAVREGRCIDTSMGFTPAAGLMMGTRSGDLDPGLVAHLGRSEGLTTEQFDQLINQQSGMLGISESSSDMRELLALEETDSRAADAIAMFCYQTKKWIGSYAAVLDGLDTLVFSGGIGENCDSIRSRICRGLSFLGIKIDDALNSQQASVISLPDSCVTVRVVKTDEELLMAQSVYQFLEQS